MPEFNRQPPYQGTVNPFHEFSLGTPIIVLGGAPLNSLTSQAWPSGSMAILVPFSLYARMYVDSLYWINGATVNGQVDMGIYTEDGTKVVSTGPVLQSGTTVIQVNVLSPQVELSPGLYYMALVCASSTATMRNANNSLATGTQIQMLGLAQAPNAYPLPQSITGTWRMAGQDYIPGFGISSESTTLF